MNGVPKISALDQVGYDNCSKMMDDKDEDRE